MSGISRIKKGPAVVMLAASIWLIQLIPVISFAQQDKGADPEVTEAGEKTAQVRLDGKVLFYIGGIATVSAESRAESISARIRKVAANRSISDTSLRLVRDTARVLVYAGNEFLLGVHDHDAKQQGAGMAYLAEFYMLKIKNGIVSYRLDRSRPVLLRKMVWAAGVTAVTVVLVLILVWVVRRVRAWLERRIRARIESLEDKSFRLIRSSQLWTGFRILFKTIRLLVIFLVVASYFQYILGLFPWTRGIAAYIVDIFIDPLRNFGLGILRFLPHLAVLIVIYFIARYLLKLVRLFFTGIKDGGIKLSGFDPEWALPTYKIIRLIVIIFAFVLAYPYIPGSDTDAFKGVSVFAGILFSLGSSSFISNIIAGYSMTYRGAFKKGDLIKVDETVGIVEDQKLLVTRLRSPKNEEIVIPNSELLNSNIINFTTRAKDLGLILHTTVGIGYETPWRLVDAMLKEAAERTSGLLKDPPPYILKKALGDFAVTYELNAYCDNTSGILLLYSALHQNILDVFNENNVQIMTPAYEGDPEIPKVVPKDQWNAQLKKE
jgi:small-conductance mechanosensitive channel